MTNRIRETIRARTWFVVLIVLAMAIAGLADLAKAAEYYEGEPRTITGYQFQVSGCPGIVTTLAKSAVLKFQHFFPVTAEATPISYSRGYNSVDSLTCELKNTNVEEAQWWSIRGEIVECDISLDLSAEDIYFAILHGIGHCAGLDHTLDYPEALMFPIGIGKGMHFDDIRGLCHLYRCTTDFVDDYNNLVVQKAVRIGRPEVSTGVVTVGKVVLIEDAK